MAGLVGELASISRFKTCLLGAHDVRVNANRGHTGQGLIGGRQILRDVI